MELSEAEPESGHRSDQRRQSDRTGAAIHQLLMQKLCLFDVVHRHKGSVVFFCASCQRFLCPFVVECVCFSRSPPQSLALWTGTFFYNNTLQIATTTQEELCLSSVSLKFNYAEPDYIVV
jgi:hypothetical protein